MTSTFYHNANMMSLRILVICVLDNVWILKGEVTCEQLVGVEELNAWH